MPPISVPVNGYLREVVRAAKGRQNIRSMDMVPKASPPLPLLQQLSTQTVKHRQNVHVQGKEARLGLLHQGAYYPRPYKAQSL